jgi:hypothetical protein
MPKFERLNFETFAVVLVTLTILGLLVWIALTPMYVNYSPTEVTVGNRLSL